MRVLILSQVMPQWYVDVLNEALWDTSELICITGSKVKNTLVVPEPEYKSNTYYTKLISWVKYYWFVRNWLSKDKSQNFDLVFAISNPPINPDLGLRAKKKYHAPFIYMGWDLYPQSIGAMANNLVIKMLCKLWYKANNRLYPRIDRLLTIGDIMAESVRNSISNPINMQVIPIAADTEHILPIQKENNKFLQKYGLSDKFIVLFSGKMGYGRQVDTVLESAKILREQKDICFVLIGEGTYYPIAERFIADNHLENVKLLPLQPADMYLHSIACGDVAIAAQDMKQAQFSIPSRVYSMICGGDAIIGLCSRHDDLGLLIEKNELGVCVYDHSPENLAKEIADLYNNPIRLAKMQQNARKTAEVKYSYAIVIKQYRELFQSVLKEL